MEDSTLKKWLSSGMLDYLEEEIRPKAAEMMENMMRFVLADQVISSYITDKDATTLAVLLLRIIMKTNATLEVDDSDYFRLLMLNKKLSKSMERDLGGMAGVDWEAEAIRFTEEEFLREKGICTDETTDEGA